ncbi:hypothetical protein HQ576_14370, partial [bacterium]|nr:hypothetical protein [bacterium]
PALLAPLRWRPARRAAGWRGRKPRKLGGGALVDEMASHTMSPAMLFGKKLILLARRGPDYEP